MLSLLFLIAHLLFLVFLVFSVYSFLSAAPFVPSTKGALGAMIRLAKIRSGMVVYDLGCGDGRLVLRAAAQGARAVGYEINPLLVFVGKIRVFFSSYRRFTAIRWGNLWHATISDGDVIFVYLLPWRMHRLQKLLETRAKPGTLVVTNSFVFPSWRAVAKDTSQHVFAYRIPKRS